MTRTTSSGTYSARTWRRFPGRALLYAALLLACSAEPPVAPPQPGTLTVELTTPHSDDGAMVLRVSGPGEILDVEAANPGYALHHRPAADGIRAAVFGAINRGAIVTFAVPDVRRASDYSAAVMEVSDLANELRQTLAGYILTIRH